MDYAPEIPLVHTNDFELLDFTDEVNFGQFIDQIRGDNDDHVGNFDPDLINGMLMDDDQFGPTLPGHVFDFNDTNISSLVVPDPNYAPIALPSFQGDLKEGQDDDNDGEDSSGTTTTTTTTTTTKTKPDRSRTLISERRRRGRMKDKLYALRSLVPNITKMDKASIVGDAVLYVQELQMQAKKLNAEIASLEANLGGSERCHQRSNMNPRKARIGMSNDHPICKKIIEMDLFQVQERGFYVRVVCNKGEGVAVSLYRAVESLTSFNVQSSNLATAADRFILTFTLHVKESEQNMNLPNLKLWVAGALLNQGFELATSLCS